VALKWRTEAASGVLDLALPLQRTPAARRPVSLAWRPDGSALVTIGTLGDEALLTALEARLTAEQARLRAAPYVVFDLRGNRGGNSTWGRRYAEILWGEAAVAARERPGLGKDFRASPETVEALKAVAAQFMGRGPETEPVVRYWLGLAERVAAAPEHDRALFRDYGPEEPKPAGPPPPSLYGRPVFVLTDAGCFSSCVIAADTLRRLGARQVGEVSGQNEEFGEAAGPLALPSGLARLWVPISIIRQARESLGGLPVDAPWPGALDDDPAIFAWIAGLAKATPAPAA
jgi:hypothetical protein